jgi:hypothetical protein
MRKRNLLITLIIGVSNLILFSVTLAQPGGFQLIQHETALRQDVSTALHFFEEKDAVTRFRDVQLNSNIKSLSAVKQGDEITLNLFPDIWYSSTIKNVEQYLERNVTITAGIQTYDYAYMIISTTDDRTLVNIHVPEQSKRYQITSDPATNQHYLVEMDPAKMTKIEDYPPLIPPPPNAEEQEEINKLQEKVKSTLQGPYDPAVIDVMIVYTPAAASWGNSNGGIQNLVATAMATAQLCLNNSQTVVTMRLVYSSQISYTESGNNSTDLARLRITDDGYMDAVHTWRNTYGADLVQLFSTMGGGIGYLLENTGGSPSYAFSIAGVSTATAYTPIHEMGHNMGCHHHKQQNVQPGPGLYSYSAGWRWVGTNSVRYCDLMTYESGTYFPDGYTHARVPHFSNPIVNFAGVATGDYTDGDNAWTIQNIKHVVAAYRTTSTVAGVWLGSVSSDWHNPLNWLNEQVPTMTTDVTIKSGAPNQPVITGTANCRNLSMEQNTTLTQNSGSYFHVYGTFDVGFYSTSYFTMLGSSFLYFRGDADNNWWDDFHNGTYSNVRVNKSVTTATTYMKHSSSLSGTFQIWNGKFAMDMNRTLTVNSTSTTAFQVQAGGTLELGTDRTIEVAGSIVFQDDSRLYCVGGILHCGGNFRVEANAAYDIEFGHNSWLVMNGTGTQYIQDLDGGNLKLFGLIISKPSGTCYIAYEDLHINGAVNILSGTFSCKSSFSSSTSYDIYARYIWDQIGIDLFDPGTGRVIFTGPLDAYCYIANFYELEIAKDPGSDFEVRGDIECAALDYTSGNIVLSTIWGSSSLTAHDLIDNGIFGSYLLHPGTEVNLTNNDGFVDLNGTIIFNGGGTMNIYGGTSNSWWSYGGNASVTMSGGTLDFKDVGIYVYNSGTYTFTENITGGTIRTSASFNAANSQFTPTGGVVEMYGTADVPLSQSNGATFYNLTINKSAKEGNPGPTTPTYENRNGEVLFLGGGSKANTVTPNTNITVTNNLEVTAGTLSLNTNTFVVAKTANIYGNLNMASGNLNVGTVAYDNLRFLEGSTGNVTGGAINLKSWFYAQNGSSFTASIANTMTFTGNQVTGMDVRSAAVYFGNVVVNKTAVNHLLYSTVPNVIVGGSFALQGTSEFQMQGNSMHVQGLFTDASGTKIYLDTSKKVGEYASSEGSATGSESKGGSLEIDSDFTLTGLMDLKTSGNVLVHGSFGIASTGVLTIHGTSSFIADMSDNKSDAWQYFYGTINMTGGLFELTNNSMQFFYASVNNISGGIMRCGKTFVAVAANVFQPTGGVMEFTGSNIGTPYISCGNGNYFHDLTINRTSPITLGEDIEVRRDMLIQSGPLNTNNYNIKVGRNWTNNGGSPAFGEGTSTVTFFGALSGDITTAETFYNLALDKTYASFDGLEIMSVPVTILNNLNIIDGTLELNDNTILTVGNNVDIALDAGLNAGGLDTNLEIFVGGNWTNYNTTYNTIAGYTPGGETITFNGTADQIMTTAAAIEDFNHFVVNKPGGGIKPSGSLQILGNFDIFAGDFSSNTSGLTHYFHRNFTMHGPGNYYPGTNSSTVFKGTLDQTYERLGGSGGFRNVVVDKTADKSSDLVEVIGGESIEKIEDTDGSKALTVNLLTTIVAFSGGTTTIEEGTLNLNGKNYKSVGAMNINAGGKVAVPAGSNLYPIGGLYVNNGGILETIGASGNNAMVSHDGGSAYYPFEVNAGGTIRSSFTTFRYMNTNGIYIKEGALVDATHSFHKCVFEHGAPAPSALMTIQNNQTFYVENAVFPSNTWGGSYNVYKSVNAGQVYFVTATGGFAGESYDYDPNNRIHWMNRELSLKAYLEGPFNGGGMSATLNPVLPLSHPFNPALPYFGNPMPDWYYTGAGSVAAIPNADIVDWVLIDVRDAVDAASATPATSIARFPAFISSNGAITDLTGASKPELTSSITHNLFVAIYHRNHVGIMNATPIPYATGVYNYDFSTGSTQVYGGSNAHKQLSTGVWGMMSGDGDGSGTVQTADKANVWMIQAGTAGYKAGDYNMNRQVNNPDKDDKWLPNLGKGSYIPE